MTLPDKETVDKIHRQSVRKALNFQHWCGACDDLVSKNTIPGNEFVTRLNWGRMVGCDRDCGRVKDKKSQI
jgi:hypothetical protein